MIDPRVPLEVALLALVVGAIVNAVLLFGFDPPPIPNGLRVWFWASVAAVAARRFAGLQLGWETDWPGNVIWGNLAVTTWAIVLWCWRNGDEPRGPRRRGGGP